MQHYCSALRNTRQATEAGASPTRQTHRYLRALGELLYVITNCRPTMPVSPEVYLKLGGVHLLKGNVADAKVACQNVALTT